jgi:ketosteroid isomerase-like protein
MGKKNGFNIMLFVFITLLFINLSCSAPPESKNEGILIKTDSDFSAMSVDKGMFTAFLNYIADDGVILRDNDFPTKGKKELAKYYEGRSDTSFVLSWEPVFERLAAGGDLGYTFGIWTNRSKKTGGISKGMYATTWQKQSDGSWKFVLDLGTQGLPQVAE